MRAPKGAIRKGQTLTIQTVPESRSAHGTSSIAAGPYAISTSQGEPRKPVEVTFSYKPALLHRGDHALVLHDSTIAHGWIPVGGTVDPRANTISAKIGSFSLVDVVDDASYYASMRTAPPCQTAFPDARRKTIGRTTWYNRQESMRMVLCYRFGLVPSADFPISAGMVCGMLAEVIGHGIAEKLGLFTTGACSGAEIASDPGEPTKYISAVCGWASALLKSVPAALGCTFAPSAGTSLGSLFESKHELDVAVDVARRGKCIKYSPTHFGSPWLAVDCAPGDPGFSQLPLGPTAGGGSTPGPGNSGGSNGDGPGSGEPPPASDGGYSWTALDLPVPAGGEAGSGAYVGYYHNYYEGAKPACSSGGTCALVGEYQKPGGTRQEMIDTLVNGTWSAAQIPVPPDGVAGSGSAYPGYGQDIHPVCSADGTCVLIGEYTNSEGHTRQMIDTLINGSWSAVEMPVPSGGEVGSGFAGFRGEGTYPACSADGTCVIAGEYHEPDFHEVGEELGMIATLANGTWSATEFPVPPDGEAGSGSLNELGASYPACSADGTCVLVGTYREQEPHFWRTGMIATLSNGTWSAVQIPVPLGGEAGSAFIYNSSPACSASSTCVLVGTYREPAGEDRGMIATLVSGTWSATELPVPSGGEAGSGSEGRFYPSQACSADACVAAATYREPGDIYRGMIATLAGGTWSVIELPVPPGGEDGSGSEGYLGSYPVCSANGTCVLVGEYRTPDAVQHGMIDTLVGNTWSALEPPVPSAGQAVLPKPPSGSLGANFTSEPACAADGTCMLIGTYSDSGDIEHGMIDMLLNGTWSASEMPVPSGGEAGSGIANFEYRIGDFSLYPYSVPACSANGTCVFVGTYDPGRKSMIVVGERRP